VGDEECQWSTDGGHDNADKNEQRPLVRAEHGVKDEKDGDHGDWNNNCHSLVGALLALVFAGPLGMIAGRQLHIVLDLGEGLLDGRAEVASAH